MMLHRSPVALSPRAYRDLRGLLLTIGEQWGAAQREAYLEEIDRALATLAVNPRLGRARDDLFPALHAYDVEQHVIYYRIAPDGVTVVRILPWRRDPINCLADLEN